MILLIGMVKGIHIVQLQYFNNPPTLLSGEIYSTPLYSNALVHVLSLEAQKHNYNAQHLYTMIGNKARTKT
jgi:hypothetical protein